MLRNLFQTISKYFKNNMVYSEPDLSDFEKSPLRFEMEVLLEEYRTLREETITRLSNQQQIVNFAIALIAAFFAISQLLPRNENIQYLLSSLRPIYPLISLFFSAFALMYIEHDAMMATLGSYISLCLRPQMEEIIKRAGVSSRKVWQWDEYRSEKHFHSIKSAPHFYLMAAARYAITIIPSIGSLIYYWNLRHSGTNITLGENLIFGVAVIVLLWLLLAAVHSGSLYLNLTEQLKKSNNPDNIKSVINKSGKEKKKNIFLIFLILLYLFMGIAITNQWEPFKSFSQVDFNTYYAAAKLFEDNGNIYDGLLSEKLILSYGIEYISGSDYIYPPFLAFTLIPLARFSPLIAGFIWYMVSFLSLCASVWLIVKSSFIYKKSFEFWGKFRDSLIIALIFVPTAYSFYVGQVNAILLLLLVGTFYFLETDKEIVAGFLLSLAILIKVAPVLIFIYLIGRRKFRTIFATLVFLALIILASIPFMKDQLLEYLTIIFPTLTTPAPHPVNQSLNGFFSRLFTQNNFTIPLVDIPDFVRIGVLLTSLILVGIVAYKCFLLYKKPKIASLESSLCFSQIITLIVVTSPLAWENFYVLLIFPTLLLYLEQRNLGKKDMKLFIGSILLITAQRLWDPYINSPFSFPYLHYFSIFMSLGLYGALLSLWLQIQLYDRKIVAEFTS